MPVAVGFFLSPIQRALREIPYTENIPSGRNSREIAHQNGTADLNGRRYKII